jgi:3-deoxy-D-manno-octulosonate 8-phosphate phosphatase (KDO 8-P phosphatase)
MNRIEDRLKKIRLLVLDVDGVLTDDRLMISSSGEETKTFSVRDGYGIKLLQRAGVKIVLISGRDSRATSVRARELGIQEVHQGVRDKRPVYRETLRAAGLRDEQAAFMGDDWMDVPLLLRAGFSAAVSDATGEAKKAADYVTSAAGGRGAVREVAEMILKAQPGWEKIRKEAGLDDFGGGPQESESGIEPA